MNLVKMGQTLTRIRKEKGFTIRSLAERAKVGKGTIDHYENGRVKEWDEVKIKKIATALGVTPRDLGYVSDEDEINPMPPRIVYVEKETRKNKIALVPVDAQAGYLTHYNEEQFIRSLPMYDIPGITNGYFRMFTVAGDSMEPILKSKDIVVCEYVEHYGDIRNNDIYVIVTHDGILVKRLINNIENAGAIIAISENPSYSPIAIAAGDILEIWRYERHITNAR